MSLFRFLTQRLMPGKKSTPSPSKSADAPVVDPQGEQEWQLYDDAYSRCPPRDGPYV